MTPEQVYTMLSATGYPVAYHHFKTPPALPYIVYLLPYSNNISADNKVYQKVNHLQIELYTAEKDFAAEANLETALSDLFYDKTEVYIESEGLYQVIYETKIGG